VAQSGFVACLRLCDQMLSPVVDVKPHPSQSSKIHRFHVDFTKSQENSQSDRPVCLFFVLIKVEAMDSKGWLIIEEAAIDEAAQGMQLENSNPF
jgi:hypothetical protein